MLTLETKKERGGKKKPVFLLIYINEEKYKSLHKIKKIKKR